MADEILGHNLEDVLGLGRIFEMLNYLCIYDSEYEVTYAEYDGENLILMVLGIASAISPISIITENIIDLCVLIAFTVCVWIFAGTKKKIGKIEGFAMVAFYAAYAVYIIIR